MPIFFLCNSNLGSMSFPPIHQPLGSIHSQGCWCTFHPLHHYFCPYHFCMVPLVWPLGPNDAPKSTTLRRPAEKVGRILSHHVVINSAESDSSPMVVLHFDAAHDHTITVFEVPGSQLSQLRATLQVCLCNKNARGWTWWPKTAFLIKQFWSKRGWGRFRQTTSMTCWSLIFTAVGLDVC